MKYKRNSGRNKEPDKLDKKERKNAKKEIVLSRDQERRLANQIVQDAIWIENLSNKEQFSKDWIQTVLLELLFQCMGKKDITTTNMFGQELVVRMFKEKGAIQVASILAKMEGHLFDTVKGTVKQTGTIEHQHKGQIELKPDPNRTENVLGILESCGVFNPNVKRLTKDDVEIISA